MTEALRAMVHYAFSTMDLSRMKAPVCPKTLHRAVFWKNVAINTKVSHRPISKLMAVGGPTSYMLPYARIGVGGQQWAWHDYLNTIGAKLQRDLVGSRIGAPPFPRRTGLCRRASWPLEGSGGICRASKIDRGRERACQTVPHSPRGDYSLWWWNRFGGWSACRNRAGLPDLIP